ncbi:unnamed protein product [Fraxinus pennsylvanica]|uniref:Uncharacterized protein n=1 Tax=Fraxinus pennsylvanica TaxID=56036 RepID=A0AAD2DW02_9LAMI|nr:unnamed protein product [Fraxinus pennsylvanica]
MMGVHSHMGHVPRGAKWRLPIVCNTPANVSQCPALLNLPPNSPDAQVFYQIGTNNNTASSPVSGGPKNNGTPGTTSAQQKSAGFCIENRWLGLGLILLWAFTSKLFL